MVDKIQSPLIDTSLAPVKGAISNSDYVFVRGADESIEKVLVSDLLAGTAGAIRIRGEADMDNASTTPTSVVIIGDPNNATMEQGVAPVDASPNGVSYVVKTSQSGVQTQISGTVQTVFDGDQIIWSGSKWSILALGNAVTSVDNQTGAVNLEDKYYWTGNKPNIEDIPNLQGALDIKYSPANKPTPAEIGAKANSYVPDWEEITNKPDTSTRWPSFAEVTSKPTTATRWPTFAEVTSKPDTATRWPAFSEVTGKPLYYPTQWEQVSGKPTTFPTSWGAVTGKPTTFPTTWDLVTGKPSIPTTASDVGAVSKTGDTMSGGLTIIPKEVNASSALGLLETPGNNGAWVKYEGDANELQLITRNNDTNHIKMKTTRFPDSPIIFNGPLYTYGDKVYTEGYKPTAGDIGAVSTTGGEVTGTLKCSQQYSGLRVVTSRDGNGWPNAIINDDNCWVNRCRAKVEVGNNLMGFLMEGETNARRAGIQVGHTNAQYANTFGRLELNPMGGLVRFQTATSIDSDGSSTIFSTTNNKYSFDKNIESGGKILGKSTVYQQSPERTWGMGITTSSSTDKGVVGITKDGGVTFSDYIRIGPNRELVHHVTINGSPEEYNIYTQYNKPTKSDVGLSNVPNYTISNATNDPSTNKFASTAAVYSVNQRVAALEDSSTGVDIYDGTDPKNTEFPIGTYLVGEGPNLLPNAQVILYTYSSQYDAFHYSTTSQGSTSKQLSGVWACRGKLGGSSEGALFQRIE